MKKTSLLRAAVFAAVMVSVLNLSACNDFMSSSWGSSRDYDYNNIDINADNWEEWNKRAVGNPKLAAAIQKKLGQLLETETDPEKRKALNNAAVNAAIQQSGIGTLLVGNATLLDKAEDLTEDDILPILNDLLNDFGSAGKAAADNIGGTLGRVITSKGNGQAPKLDGAFCDLEPGAAGQAVVVLAMALADDEANGIDLTAENFSLDEFFEVETENSAVKDFTFDTVSGSVVLTDASNPDPNALALAALLNTIAVDTTGKYEDNPVTRGIKDAFLEAK